MIGASLILSLALTAATPQRTISSADFPQPDYPQEYIRKDDSGVVLLFIQFNGEGKASFCYTVRSTTSPGLADYTRDFVLKNWSLPRLAGQSDQVLISYRLRGDPRNFDFPPMLTDQYYVGLVAPTFLDTFDENGFVESCNLEKSSGDGVLDSKLAAFMKAHWHRAEFAGKTAEVQPNAWRRVRQDHLSKSLTRGR